MIATIITPVIGFDGEIKTQSLMGNVYYRYPKWRVSPYVGFGLGAFFHDKTSIVSIEFGPLPPDVIGPGGIPTEALNTTAYEDSRFAYQIMGGLSARVSKRVEFRFGYRFRSSRGGPIDADQIESGILIPVLISLSLSLVVMSGVPVLSEGHGRIGHAASTRRLGSDRGSLGRSTRPGPGAPQNPTTGAARLHRCRSGKPACLGQRSGPRTSGRI